MKHFNQSFITLYLTCDSEGETGSDDEMGEGGTRNRGEGVMTGMLRELLLVAIVLEAEDVKMTRLSGRVSVLGL